MALKITFLLPGHSERPVGGFRVVYEYANRLAELGHKVVVVNICTLCENEKNLKTFVSYYLRLLGLRGTYRPDKWFSVSSKVSVLWKYNLNLNSLPNANVVVATAWQTAERLKYFGCEKGAKYYLIHDYEHYKVSSVDIRRRIADTYHYGYFNIVTSPAGIELLNECKAPIGAKISNGVDFKIYNLYNKIDYFKRNMIGFPARLETFKGSIDAIKALEMLKDNIAKDHKVWAFGPVNIPRLPSWIEFYLNPNNKKIAELMNKTAIFILPSHYEGWGLPGAEAMACGASLVTTDNVGVRDYAVDNENSLYAQAGSYVSIADKISKLLNDEVLRINIATKGYESIQKYSWDKSTNEMVKIFNN